ncbi:carboxypeptidase-like regulatory domain-containing protein [Hymenobacter saemangeumensis]|uniref:Carboxypeptidase-like regulatory domain-containing protein n=2 Tax=Hymenobacter saemangeumensis TaxID=1084522 RepID=A0ABP8IGA3_9BACT
MLLLAWQPAAAQLSQSVRGRVTEGASGRPIGGAQVELVSGEQHYQTDSDSLGYYVVSPVPPGYYRLQVQRLGYHPYQEPELVVESSKVVYRPLVLQTAAVALGEVQVGAPQLSSLHQREFTAAQTQRFPATFFDPARLVLSQPGITQANDQANHVVVHGLAPQGIQWRLQGLPILNPNHLSNAGVRSDRATGSGGGVNMLSGQLLANSAFRTGALSSRFGNAVSGVFDINLRPGSAARREHTFQASLLGLDLATEGPLGADHSTYLVNYRYSTVGLLGLLGVDFGGESIRYQDVSAHVQLEKTALGQLSFFVLAGNNANELRPLDDSLSWEQDKNRQRIDFRSSLAAAGMSQSASIGKGQWQNGLAFSTLRSVREQAWLGSRRPLRSQAYDRQTARQLSAYSRYLRPLGSRLLLEAGVQAQAQHGEEHSTPLPAGGELRADISYTLVQPYVQADWVLLPALTLQTGLRLSYLSWDQQARPEPYGLLAWQPVPAHRFQLSYSRQSQVLSNGQLALLQAQGPARRISGLIGSHYSGLGWAWRPRPVLRLTAEVFYQQLRQLPASARDVWWNYLGEPGWQPTGQGHACTFGVDASLQRSFSRGLYYQLAASVFDARYAGTDGQLRNTPFNSRWAGAFTGGKEWTKQKAAGQRVWGLNLRLHSRGGYYFTAIDEAQSLLQRQEVDDPSKPYQERLPTNFSLDLRLSHTRHKPGYTRLWSLDLQNLTGTPNVGWYYYDFWKQARSRQFQQGLIPVLAYRIQF